MIKSKEDMIKETKERMRGGDGQVLLTHLFKPGEYDGKARLIAQISLEPGCSIGRHEHLHEEEIFYIISGEGILTESSDDPGRMVHAGDATITRAGGSHSIRNEGSKPLHLLALILLAE